MSSNGSKDVCAILASDVSARHRGPFGATQTAPPAQDRGLSFLSTASNDMNMAQLHNPHAGEILKEEFLTEIGMSQNQLAHAIGVPGN